jgi:hypothetical protein
VYISEQYDYAIEDIVIMLDDGKVQTDLTPTYDNIVRENYFIYGLVITGDFFLKLSQIDNMVHSAQAGDQFFFACLSPFYPYLIMTDDRADSGHSGQVTNRRGSEEDERDEGEFCPASYPRM